MQEKVLVTGASGFVGGHLVQAALDAGYDVHAGLRRTSSRKQLVDPRTKFFVLDFDDATQLTNDLSREKFDYIIHNAGLTAGKTQERLNKVNYGTLKTLVECIRMSRYICKKLVLTSSLAAYGPADMQAGSQVTLNDTPKPVTRYGRSKLKAEQYLAKQQDIPYIILRPTAVYGPRDKEFLTVYKTVKNRLKVLPGLSPQVLTFTYVKDLAQVFVHALRSTESNKAYFVTDGSEYTTEHFNDVIASKLNRKTLTLRLPIWLVSIVATISESLGQLRGTYPVLNKDKVNELRARSWTCDGQTTIEELGYSPSYSLDDGLEETIAWCKQQKLL